MKKLLLLLTLVLCLSGCGMLVEDTYLVTEKHSEQPTEPSQEPSEQAEPSVISNRSQLRGAVLSCIRNWLERDTLRVQDYEGDLDTDLPEIVRYATEEDPIGAFAVDFVDAELHGSSDDGRIELSIVFRRSAAEIDSIVTVNTTANALRRIEQALTSYETALTLRIRDYDETDFASHIRAYALENPDLVLALPEVSAEVYPPSGQTRILEVHFNYPHTREQMRTMHTSVRTLLSSAFSYVSSGTTDAERVELLSRFLMMRYRYHTLENEPAMPAYELLQEGRAHSLSFATVFRYECTLLGIESYLVSGTRNDLPHYWNIVHLDGVYYHVDLMRGIESEESGLHLFSEQEMLSEGYAWALESYPQNPEPTVDAEPHETESVQPTESDEPDPTELPEPTEEPVPSEEPTDPTDPTEP